MVEKKASLLPPIEEKAIVVDEDGAKTVEVIEETMVPIAPLAIEEVTLVALAAESEKEASGEMPTIVVASEEVFIWGVPLMGDEKSNTLFMSQNWYGFKI